MVRIECPSCGGLGKIRNWIYTKEAKDIEEAERAKESKRKEEELNNEKQIIENKRIEEAEHIDLQTKLNNGFDDNSKIVAVNIDGQEPYEMKIFEGAIPNYNWAKTNTLNNTEWRLPTKTELVYLLKNNIINFQTQYGFWSGSIETDRSYSNGKTVWVAEKKPDWGGKSNNEKWTCGKDIFINANYCLKLVFISDENEDRTDNNVLNLKNPKYDVIVVKKIKTTHNSTQNQSVDKTDDSEFNKTNISVTERSGVIKFTVNENSNIDIMNMFLTNNDKQVLGIKTWSFISFVVAQTDSESFITKIRIQDKKGMFLLLTNEDAEKFEIAKRFIQKMKDKIRY